MPQKATTAHKALKLIVLLDFILVSLFVGLAMIDRTISVSFLPEIITSVAGWLILIFTVLGVLFSIIGLSDERRLYGK